MGQRIRYGKQDNGTLKSRRNFSLPDGRQVYVILSPATMAYEALDAASLQSVLQRSGETRNLAVLKIKAKEGLESLGVVFTDEARKPRKAKV